MAPVIAVTLAIPLLLCSALWVTDQSGGRHPTVRDQLQAISAQHAAQARGCFTAGPFNERSTRDCVWDSSQAGTPIYLVGDSNAAQFSEAVIRAGVTLGRPVRIFTTPSCPLIENLTVSMDNTDELLPPDVAPTEFDHCHSYVNYTLDWLAHAPRGTVVVASLDQYWWDPHLSASLARGPASRNPAAKAALMQKGLETTIGRLRAAGQEWSSSSRYRHSGIHLPSGTPGRATPRPSSTQPAPDSFRGLSSTLSSKTHALPSSERRLQPGRPCSISGMCSATAPSAQRRATERWSTATPPT